MSPNPPNPLRTLTNRFETDERGVSEVIGAILVFGLLIALLTIVQTQLVPDANEEVEFEHSQDVQGDLSHLQAAISRTAARGSSESVSVELGTDYPTRLILYNPPPVSGTLRTTDPRSITISNVEALNPETADYLGGTGAVTGITSRSVIYRVDYHRYSSAPTMVAEYGALVSNFSEGTVVENGASLVSGRTISLVTIAGEVSETQVNVASIPVNAVSAAERTVAVRNEDANGNGDLTDDPPLKIEVPTMLSESTWEEILQTCEDIDGNDVCDSPDPKSHITDFSVTSGTLTITLEKGVTYNLRMARVGLGTGFDEPEAHYITTVSPATKSVARGGSATLVVEVRDRFNNPVSGVEVSASATGGSVSVVGPGTTDEDGRVYLRYVAPDVTGNYGVEVTFDGGGTDQKTVTFEVSVGPTDATVPEVNDVNAVKASTQTCNNFAKDSINFSIAGVSVDQPVLLCPGNFRTLHQVTVEYTISDTTSGKVESGLDHVRIEVFYHVGSDDILITSTTIDANGAASLLSQQWVSPWLDTEPTKVVVTAVDRAGKESDPANKML